MLILGRKEQESIQIGDDIIVQVVAIHGTIVRLGITAPREISVVRTELLKERNTGHDTEK